MRTSGYVMQDRPNPDGHIIIDAAEYSYASGGAITRTGQGLINLVIPASATTIVTFDLTSILLRYGMQDDAQQLFGQNNGQSGANAQALLPGVSYNAITSNQSRSPVPSASVFGNGTGAAPFIGKGITVKAINLAYQVLGANLTSMTVGLTKTQYATGVAPVVTNILPVANNGLLLPVSANPTIVNVPIPLANQLMLTSRLAKYLTEVTFVAPAGSTVNFAGLFFDVAYNYN